MPDDSDEEETGSSKPGPSGIGPETLPEMEADQVAAGSKASFAANGAPPSGCPFADTQDAKMYDEFMSADNEL